MCTMTDIFNVFVNSMLCVCSSVLNVYVHEPPWRKVLSVL